MKTAAWLSLMPSIICFNMLLDPRSLELRFPLLWRRLMNLQTACFASGNFQTEKYSYRDQSFLQDPCVRLFQTVFFSRTLKSA
jgi:hypothetical protein